MLKHRKIVGEVNLKSRQSIRVCPLGGPADDGIVEQEFIIKVLSV